MTSKKRSLGKGLNELLSATLGTKLEFEVATEEKSAQGQALKDQELSLLTVDKLVEGIYQPRQQIRHEGLEQLAESIRAQGILQPILVRPKADKFEIIAGERRWRAAQLAGLTEVPAIIRDIPDQAAIAMALIENIQRENLNPVEEAMALKRLAEELQLTHLQVAEAVGKSRASVTNSLRLLNLNPDVLTMLEQGELEMGHARALLALSGPMQTQVARTVVQRALSVRATEQLVNKLQQDQQVNEDPKVAKIDPNIKRLEQDLADKLGTPIVIRHGRRGGVVVIKYHNVDELEGILAHIK